MISDLPCYVKYWRNKFTRLVEEGASNCEDERRDDKSLISNILAKYTTCLQMDLQMNENLPENIKENKGIDTSKQIFYFLSDVLPEDKEIRTELQMRKLQHVLDIQEGERNDYSSFNRCCLFCRSNFQGVSHSKLFDHMAFEHNFSVGKPDNLVYINDLLDVLEDKLEKMVCIYCEKVFKSREVLKEHMRKKNHKKINPRNIAYDKFYIVNYLEFGKSWKEVSKEREAHPYEDEEELPSGFDEFDDNSTDDEEKVEDTDDESIISSEFGNQEEHDWSDWRKYLPGFVCLLCPATYKNSGSGASDLFLHMKSIHKFDFVEIKESMKLSFYQQVKLVNYIRRQVHLNACIHCDEKIESIEMKSDSEEYKKGLLEHMTKESHMKLPDDKSEWDQSQYLFPTYENDLLLSYLPDEGRMFKND